MYIISPLNEVENQNFYSYDDDNNNNNVLIILIIILTAEYMNDAAIWMSVARHTRIISCVFVGSSRNI